MPKAKHHDKPFDPGTVVKLTLFERYLESFLPVFIHHPGIQKINIFDFFCGPGADIKGRRGSPIRAVDAISKHAHSFKQSNLKISAFFSDIDSKKN